MALVRQLADMRAERDVLRDTVKRQTAALDELKEHKESYAVRSICSFPCCPYIYLFLYSETLKSSPLAVELFHLQRATR